MTFNILTEGVVVLEGHMHVVQPPRSHKGLEEVGEQRTIQLVAITR